jgi:pimeloyl-ACP methyl ester carboxylesterase
MSIKNTTRQFISSHDGTRLFVETFGDFSHSKKVLFLCDGIGCQGFIWKYITEYFHNQLFIVHMHYRGHGKSDKPSDTSKLRIEDLADDIAGVLDALKIKSAIIAGHSMGVQVSLEFFNRHRQRTDGLLLFCGTYGKPLDTFHDNSVLKMLFPLLYWLVLKNPAKVESFLKRALPTNLFYTLALLIEVNGRLINRNDFFPYLEHISNMDVEVFLRMLHFAAQHTVDTHLAEIDRPVLIISGSHDNFTPKWLSYQMYEKIPDSELLVVQMGSHTAPLEQYELVCLRMEKFFHENFRF